MLAIFVGSRYKGVQNMQATLQRAVGLPAVLRGTNVESCHFRVHFNVPYQRLCVVQTADRVTFVYISTRRTSGSVWYRWRVVSLSCKFQRSVLAALCDADDGSYHFHRTVLAALSRAGVCLCLFLLLNVFIYRFMPNWGWSLV